MSLKRQIEQYAQVNGFIVGFCDAEKLDYLENDARLADVPFTKYPPERRIAPKLLLPAAKSVIVIGVGYGKKKRFEDDGAERGVFSVSAVGLDYHVKVKKISENLRDFMLGYEPFDSIIQVDTGPLFEREFAKKAGIAWQGKNGNVNSGEFGAFFNIGLMLTTLDFGANESNPTDFSLCGECDVCIRACPGGAIQNGGKSFDYRVCVSYLTQKKGGLTAAEQALIGNNLYGCDVCQRVCRYNLDKAVSEITKIDAAKPLLAGFEDMTEDEFEERYGETAVFWRGLKIIQRNAGYALNNLRKNGNN